MTLDEICNEIMDIEEGLLYGEISFTYDRLMSAMKAGHPMEILDGIIAEIFWDVRAGKEPELDKVKNVLKNLQDYKRCFKVKELTPVIKALKAYVQEQEK